jgi:hypothetical protein
LAQTVVSYLEMKMGSPVNKIYWLWIAESISDTQEASAIW